MDGENGHQNSENSRQNGQVYVRFGPRHTQEVPIEWAEEILTELKSRNEALFGKLLVHAASMVGRGRT